jgi:hypothetical protein
LPARQFFELLKVLQKVQELSFVKISTAIADLTRVMQNSVMIANFNGQKLVEECNKLKYFIGLLKAIPMNEKALEYIGNRISAANKEINSSEKYDDFSNKILAISTMKDPLETDEEKAKKKLFETKTQAFAKLSSEIELQLQDMIENVVVFITDTLVLTVENFVNQQLINHVIPYITTDADVFINNTGNISVSQLNAVKEIRGGESQICATRKYTKEVEEFKKYIQACVGDTVVTQSNPAYDVLVKIIIGMDKESLYLPTFSIEKS